MTKPLWLMDVDGPLNILHNRLPGPDIKTFKAGNGFHIMFKPDILDRLAGLHEKGLVELQWLTTWEELADIHLAEELGLPRGLVVAGTHKDDDGKFFWWKHNAASRLLNEGHRLIWTDDDLAFEVEAREWLDAQDPQQIIWNGPDEKVGITHEFIDRVENWI